MINVQDGSRVKLQLGLNALTAERASKYGNPSSLKTVKQVMIGEINANRTTVCVR